MKAMIEFPLELNLRIIGRQSSDFETQVKQVALLHVPELTVDDVWTRASSNGNYLSVIVHFTAQSRQHLEALCADLQGREDVLMVL